MKCRYVINKSSKNSMHNTWVLFRCQIKLPNLIIWKVIVARWILYQHNVLFDQKRRKLITYLKNIIIKFGSVTLLTSLFMFFLISFSTHFIVHVSSHFLQSTLHCSCFISFHPVHTSLIMFHFYFLQSTVHLIHFIYYSPSHSYLPYLVWIILHGHSSLLSVSLFSQSRL